MTTMSTTLAQLNNYTGDNIWEDLIFQLDYDEAASVAAYRDAGRNPYASDMAVIGGITYRYDPQRHAWQPVTR